MTVNRKENEITRYPLRLTTKKILTALSVIGGRTTVFSMVVMTIFHSSLRSRFSTVFSQECAYRDNESSRRSIRGTSTSSASTMTALRCDGCTCPVPFTAASLSPISFTLTAMRTSRLRREGWGQALGLVGYTFISNIYLRQELSIFFFRIAMTSTMTSSEGIL